MNRDLDYLALLMSAVPGTVSVEEVAEWIYSHGFVVRYPTRPSEPLDGESILNELIAANRGRPGWDEGWSVEFAAEDGSVIASKGSVRRQFEPGGFVTHGIPGNRPKYSDSLDAFAAVESRASNDDFYFAFGETVDPFQTPEDQLRLYWNISESGAAPLVAAVTREFNRFQIPFQFKCAYRTGEFYRLDSAVLYLCGEYWELSSKLLRRIYEQVKAWLAPETPMLAKRLSGGLALAENPPEGRSFGLHRARLVALAVVAAAEGGEPIAELTRVFREVGLDLERPYLNPDSQDRYDFP